MKFAFLQALVGILLAVGGAVFTRWVWAAAKRFQRRAEKGIDATSNSDPESVQSEKNVVSGGISLDRLLIGNNLFQLLLMFLIGPLLSFFGVTVLIAALASEPLENAMPGSIAILCLIGGLLSLRQHHKSRLVPVSKARSAAQGQVRMIVEVSDLPKLESPLSGRTCSWYDYRVTRFGSSPMSTSTIDVVESGRSPFLVQVNDATGSCFLDLAGITVDLEADNLTLEPHQETRLPPGMVKYADKKHGFSETLLLPGKKLLLKGEFSTLSKDDIKTARDPEIMQRHEELGADRVEYLERFDNDLNGTISDKERAEAIATAASIIGMERVALPDLVGIVKPQSMGGVSTPSLEKKQLQGMLLLSIGLLVMSLMWGAVFVSILSQ